MVNKLYVIGLMSGTSADGIDVALCELDGAPPKLSARVLHAETFAYDREMRARILKACDPHNSAVNEICILNVDLAERFSWAILELLNKAGVDASQVDLIASHGQTVWHEVNTAGKVSATLQIGEGSVIAERTGITVIDNFRARDVANGGQGAPLTSYVDWLLLRHEQKWRAIQNIGGMGNVSFLPPLSDNESRMVAFDTGAGNALIDVAVSLLTDGRQTYDRDGAMARAGAVNGDWLEELLDHPYYQRVPPKTTGRELFGTATAQAYVAEGQRRGLTAEEIVATLTALTAHSIAHAYQTFAPAPIGEVILGGGGRHNPVLVQHLRDLLSPSAVFSHEEIGIDSDFKEALVFAVLAYETWHHRVGVLPEQTGARSASVLGQITPAKNYLALLERTWRK